MGFKRSQVTPIGPVSTITPASKNVHVKAFSVLASGPTTQTVVAWLPANATLVDATIAVKTQSGATNTGVSVGAGSVTNNIFNAALIGSSGTPITRVSLAGQIANVEGDQPGSDIPITVTVTTTNATGEAIVMLFYVT